ncbi:MAG: hypothetical protein C0176_00125 [Mesoaciditoga sp.]|uniref:hypothetical protein n=1 Tax=Athalassotoga sp. TaxID=2022597 RepID=UPI000CC902FF|nr:MAG: hypothetical protein C0176_00125 [Mesoaciditoga sp.]HEU24462.1 hypothetical protein [Mesoaciditoga lauensis]
MKKALSFILLFIPVLTFAMSFPYGSVMNFNPAYMVYNKNWSISYEMYFGKNESDLLIFQPFKDGFAGKIGLYTFGATSGVAYSVATKAGNLNIGSDFLISNYGTDLSVTLGLGMVEQISQNFDLSVRMPQVLTYTYQKGISVYPNFEAGVNFLNAYWNAGAFLSIGQMVSGGVLANLSIFNFQILARLSGGYVPQIPSLSQNSFDLNVESSIGSISFAYLYRNAWGTYNPEQLNGFRVSAKW